MESPENREVPPMREPERPNQGLSALDLLRQAAEAPVVRPNRPIDTGSAADILNGFEVFIPPTTPLPPTTDAFAGGTPAGGSETGGFNPAMFGD